jgi:VanZ family protein
VPKQLFFGMALFWAGIIAFFCLIKSSTIPAVSIPNLDKAVHAFFHFVLTLLWFLFFQKQMMVKSVFKPLYSAVLFSFFYGIGIEIMQGLFTDTRSADVLDVLANVTGAILASVAILVLKKIIK